MSVTLLHATDYRFKAGESLEATACLQRARRCTYRMGAGGRLASFPAAACFFLLRISLFCFHNLEAASEVLQ